MPFFHPGRSVYRLEHFSVQLVEPRDPKLPDQLIDLRLVATATRELDIAHPARSPGSHRIGKYRDHHTLTFQLNCDQPCRGRPSLLAKLRLLPASYAPTRSRIKPLFALLEVLILVDALKSQPGRQTHPQLYCKRLDKMTLLKCITNF